VGNACFNFLIDVIGCLTKKLWVTHAPVAHKRCKAALNLREIHLKKNRKL
jgi:hypothetical protein